MELQSNSIFDKADTHPMSHSKIPPSNIDAISEQPLSGRGIHPSNPDSIGGPQSHKSASGRLDSLISVGEIFIRQKTKSCWNPPEVLEILDEYEKPILSASIHSGIDRTGRMASRSTTYTVSEWSGRIVLQFVETEGANVTSGNYSLGNIHRSGIFSREIVATATGGLTRLALSHRSQKCCCSFCISFLNVNYNGDTIGQIEKVSEGMVKLSFPRDLDVRSKGLLLSLALKGYLDYFADICGFSGGFKGKTTITYFVAIGFLLLVPAAFMSIIMYARYSDPDT